MSSEYFDFILVEILVKVVSSVFKVFFLFKLRDFLIIEFICGWMIYEIFCLVN